MSTTGTFTRNSQCQLSSLRMRPPMTGPRMGPRATGTVTTAIILPMPFMRPPAACTASDCMSGNMIPAPRPWITRNAMRLPASHAVAQRIEPSRKTLSAMIQRRFPPTRDCAQPTRGIATARASR